MARRIDAATAKLAIKLQDGVIAAALVRGGFINPHQIRGASNAQLLAVPGIGAASVRKIREKLPRK